MARAYGKYLRRLLLTPLLLLVVVYAILAGFLWWSERSIAGNLSDHPSVYVRSTDLHTLTLLDTGVESLEARLRLIDEAKETIELESFIYELDEASQMLTQRLVDAANRGVKVRVLVDFAGPVFKLQPQYAQRLARHNIQVRYYNTTHTVRFVSVQHRSHRKLLIIDQKQVITGGRNIGNDYFNLSTSYSFLDSDILIRGPIAAAVRTSFDTYWESSLASSPKAVPDDHEITVLDSFFSPSVKLKNFEQKLNEAMDRIRPQRMEYECRDLTFATDHPGVLMNNRQVYYRLAEILKEAKHSVVAESPYFILRTDGLELLESISQRGIKPVLLTNGLKATDAYYTVSATALVLDEVAQTKAEIYVYNGEPPAQPNHLAQPIPTRWGLHAKRAVIDQRHTLIGTYNIDPRSANLNSEVMIVCRDNPELAKAMLANMQQRRKNSHLLFSNESSALSALIQNAPTSEIIKFFAAMPLAYIFDFLL